MRYFVPIVSLSALALAGCATVPSPIAGKDFAAVTPKQITAQDAHGTRVRWGGEIIKVEPKAEETCFEVLSRSLYPDARPNRRDDSDGRFIACGHGFYDPEVYKKGRDLTVTGQIAGTEQHLVGEHAYTYARVDAEGVYLWPKREAQPLYDPWGSYFYDPFWGPFSGPYWFAPPVVVIHGPPPHQ